MAIHARLLRTLLPALVGAGLVLAACSSDSDDPGDGTEEPSKGGTESSGGSSAGSPETPEAGSPSGGSGGSSGTGTGGTNGGTDAAGGEPDPGTGGTPTEPGGGEAGSGGAGGDGAGPTEPTEGFVRGHKIYDDKCATCHQKDLGGLYPYANISPHPVNGIGSWSDDEIKAAINQGTEPGKPKLCSLMIPFPELVGQELSDLVEFLRGSAPVDRVIAECTIGDK